ncbi:MAG: hypothetical protein B7Z83_06845 [Thiomonas sp. 20-64-5]|nr:MAG: hypothetical protein B7Z83_06845 [Thiomonas sp. 20-64-5]
MSRRSIPVLSRLKPLAPLLGALMCWLVQYGSSQSVAAQVAPLFQAAIAAAWAMLLLWLWTRWRGTALFAQGASLLSALWGGVLFTLQWGCLYLAVDRQALWLVALNFLLLALLALSAGRAAWRPARVPLWLLGMICGLLLGVWSWKAAQGGAWLLTLVAAGSFVIGFRQTGCARMAPQDLMRWRFYQLSVAALLLPLVAVAFSPSWNFIPDGRALSAMLSQAVCGGLAFPFLLAWASPQAGNEAARDAHIARVIRPDAP